MSKAEIIVIKTSFMIHAIAFRSTSIRINHASIFATCFPSLYHTAVS